MAELGVAQGISAQKFEVLDHKGLNASTFKCASLCSRGDLVYISAAGVVTIGTTGLGANARYAGFIDTNVITQADLDVRVIGQHGDYAAQTTGVVSVWQEGEFRVSNVSGVIGDNVAVYPAANGALSASQTGSDKAVGFSITGNGGVSGKPITIRISNYNA